MPVSRQTFLGDKGVGKVGKTVVLTVAVAWLSLVERERERETGMGVFQD